MLGLTGRKLCGMMAGGGRNGQRTEGMTGKGMYDRVEEGGS